MRFLSFLRTQFHLTIFVVYLAFDSFAADSARFVYPRTREAEQVDDYNGTKIKDPYRWLEDDNSEETKAWVEAQNKVTFDYLRKISERESIKRRLTDLWNFERYGVPFNRGSRYFLTKNDGLQNQSVLYTMDSLSAAPRVLLDPNKLSSDGTVALAGYDLTEDGNLLAYAISRSGSDWREWRVRDVRTGEDLSDLVKWGRFSSIVDERGSRFFLQPLRRAKQDQRVQRRTLFSENFLSSPRHAAIGRQIGLRAQRSKGMGILRRRHR